MAFSPLTTGRLTLRAMVPGDAADLAERRSDPATARYQAWVVPYPVESAQALIDAMVERGDVTPGEWFLLAVERTKDGRIVGDVGIRLSEDSHTAEIGYTLHPWARGHYFSTEATGAVCDYVVNVLGVHRIEATTDPGNLPSVRVLDRLGFIHEGTKRESYWVGDRITDDAMYGLLAREWKQRQ
ncbi:GNAT family N-acetyltransferase [Demequina aurantiaca]|uniref:GNAT family N-acetyltransferase n=1 Tax=Demequina aurantiaca TaxID=676200 RepID=UPI00078563F2|nr:GNAT family protein [Demequina aurantiaca]